MIATFLGGLLLSLVVLLALAICRMASGPFSIPFGVNSRDSGE